MSFGEPWEAIEDDNVAIDRDGDVMATCYGTRHAERIVACVNALAGLDPEAVKEAIEAACWTLQQPELASFPTLTRRLRDALASLERGEDADPTHQPLHDWVPGQGWVRRGP